MMISLLLIFFVSTGYTQETPEVSMEKKLYQEYKKNGVEKALKMYSESDMKGNEYTFLSEPLNQLGYHIMQQDNDLNAAEKIFMAQIDEYPNEANPYDSYADLLMAKGDEAGAKENYKKAISLSANMDDVEAKQRMLEASKPKLAKLEGAGNTLDFLEGTWNTKNYNIQNGNKTLSNEGTVTFTKEDTMLKGKMIDKSGNYIGSRIIAYDAVNDEYDMAYIGSSLSGIEPSTLKVEKATPEKVVIIESFQENGKDRKVKHVLNRKGGEIAWDIMDLSNGQDNKVAEMVFNKQQ